MTRQEITEYPRHILFINVTRIGDTILVTPAIRAVAETYPLAEITVWGHPKRSEIYRHLPFIKHVGSITKVSALWRGRTAHAHYDLAFVYGHDPALIKCALRISKHVVAFRQNDPVLNSRLFRAVEYPPALTEHLVQLQLRLPAAIGISTSNLRLAYQVDENEAGHARREIADSLPSASSPIIGLQVASFPTKSFRDWPISHFIELAERIVLAYPQTHFLALGGPDEQGKMAELTQHLGGRVTVFAGKLSLRQTAALMNCLDLYIGVDTGPTHIMGALHRPMVALYHPSFPRSLLEPIDNPYFRAIEHPGIDSPSSQNASMSDISVDTVWNAVRLLLEKFHR
jgi:heptosyltransferase-3